MGETQSTEADFDTYQTENLSVGCDFSEASNTTDTVPVGGGHFGAISNTSTEVLFTPPESLVSYTQEDITVGVGRGHSTETSASTVFPVFAEAPKEQPDSSLKIDSSEIYCSSAKERAESGARAWGEFQGFIDGATGTTSENPADYIISTTPSGNKGYVDGHRAGSQGSQSRGGGTGLSDHVDAFLDARSRAQ